MAAEDLVTVTYWQLGNISGHSEKGLFLRLSGRKSINLESDRVVKREDFTRSSTHHAFLWVMQHTMGCQV